VRRFFILLAALALSACGSTSSLLPPVELVPIDNPLRVDLEWHRTIGGGVGEHFVKITPVYHNGVGYAADLRGLVRAFDSRTGQSRWEKQLDVFITGGLSIIDDMLIIGTYEGEILTLNINTGNVVWRTKVSSEVLSPAEGENHIIVVRTIDGKIHALESSAGKLLWTYSRSVPLLTLRGTSAPAVNNGIVVVGMDNGKLIALTLQSGTELWETPITIAKGRSELERLVDIDVTPIVIKDVVYAVSYQGRIAAVQLDSGKILWVRELSAYSGMAIDAYRIYISDAESNLWALNRFNGSTLWKQDKLLRRSITAPVLKGRHLVVADYNGYVHWLQRDDGKLVARKRVKAINFLFVDDDQISENEKLFPKNNNVLVTPAAENNSILVLDRLGNLEAYRLNSENK
jgi:outer membrane protein assembly factor BamB